MTGLNWCCYGGRNLPLDGWQCYFDMPPWFKCCDIRIGIVFFFLYALPVLLLVSCPVTGAICCPVTVMLFLPSAEIDDQDNN